ncbi:unnamed protein product [Symbiodinium microadriaticum]|nr:unnamed protein product [Symbiodinium microadriaticum]
MIQNNALSVPLAPIYSTCSLRLAGAAAADMTRLADASVLSQSGPATPTGTTLWFLRVQNVAVELVLAADADSISFYVSSSAFVDRAQKRLRKLRDAVGRGEEPLPCTWELAEKAMPVSTVMLVQLDMGCARELASMADDKRLCGPAGLLEDLKVMAKHAVPGQSVLRQVLQKAANRKPCTSQHQVLDHLCMQAEQ